MGQSPKNASVGWLVARHPLADSQPEHLSVGFGQVKLSIQIHWSNDWMNDIFIILTNMARGVVGALSHRTDVAKCLHDWGHCLAGLANPGVARLSPKQGREGRMGGIPPFVSRPTLLFPLLILLLLLHCEEFLHRETIFVDGIYQKKKMSHHDEQRKF